MVYQGAYISGSKVMVIEFVSEASYSVWVMEVERIKHHIALINDKDEIHDYSGWMKSVHDFRKSVGDGMVPRDIRDALNSVENGEGLELTVFEE